MNPNELRELADAVAGCGYDETTPGFRAAAYLREQADRQEQSTPIGWIEGPHGALRANPDYRFQGPQTVAWSFPLYLHPVPPTCIGKDPSCPCQDGDICHYRDSADGTKGWPIPAPADVVEALRELVALKKMKIAEISDFELYSDRYAKAWQNAKAALAAADQKAAMQRATDIGQDLGLYESKETKCD